MKWNTIGYIAVGVFSFCLFLGMIALSLPLIQDIMSGTPSVLIEYSVGRMEQVDPIMVDSGNVILDRFLTVPEEPVTAPRGEISFAAGLLSIHQTGRKHYECEYTQLNTTKIHKFVFVAHQETLVFRFEQESD